MSRITDGTEKGLRTSLKIQIRKKRLYENYTEKNLTLDFISQGTAAPSKKKR